MILNSDPKLDALLEQALTGSAAFADELRAELMRRLTAARDRGAGPDQLAELARSIINAYQPHLADMLADARLAGWLRGNVKVLDAVQASGGGAALPPRVPAVARYSGDLPPLPGKWLPLIEEAAKDLRERQLLTRPEFDAVVGAIRDRALTVAKLTSTEALEHVREGLWNAVGLGDSLKTFRDHMRENVETSELGAGHLENVFRTGTGSAYAAGLDRLANHPGVADRFPYRERIPIEDSRITELCEHLARYGIEGTGIYRAADPAWQRTRPLSHFSCRCGTKLLTIAQAAQRGLTSAQYWLRTGSDPRDFVTMPDLSHLQGYIPNWRPGGGAL